MLTGKQRAYLKSMANTMEPLFQIGKNGVSENFIKQVEEALEAREIIKINVLKINILLLYVVRKNII